MPADGTFHGPFVVRVARVNSAREQRLSIRNSNASDGQHPGVVGQAVSVTGDTWTLDLEWKDTDGEWKPSWVDQSVEFTVDDGLMFRLRALNVVLIRDLEGTDSPPFDHLLVTVTSTDPEVNPTHPAAPPPDFTLPESAAG
jgi:hypothetical protein